MSNPVLARNDQAGDRFYTWGEPPEAFYSVTTIIGGGVPKYLSAWAAKSVAELVLDDLLASAPHSRARAAIRRWAAAGRADLAEKQAAGLLTSLKPAKIAPLEYAGRWLKGTPDRIRDAAGQKGIDFHDEAERQILLAANLTGDAWSEGDALPAWPEHLTNHRASFLRFLKDWHPVYQMTEASVFNRREAYAGTLDAVVDLKVESLVAVLVDRQVPIPLWLHHLRRDGADFATLVLDYKSGNDVYPEVALQLAPYARAEFVGLADGRTEGGPPVIHGGLVLHVTERGYRLRLVDIGDPSFAAFLHAREIFRARKELFGRVFLADLTIAETKEAAA